MAYNGHRSDRERGVVMFLAADQFGHDRHESVDGETFVNVFGATTREALEANGYNIWSFDSRRGEWTL